MADVVKNPHNWDEAVAVAWCFVLGQTVAEASESTGKGETTIRNWLSSPWWPTAYAEARAKVPAHFAELALGAIGAGLKAKDQTTARYAADRLVPELTPPTVKQHVSGEVKIKTFTDFMADDDDV